MITTARRIAAPFTVASLLALAAAPVSAQIGTVDPSSPQAHSDLAPAGSGQPETSGTQPPPESGYGTPQPPQSPPSGQDQYAPPATNASRAPDSQTYEQHDVLDAAEGVFGRGAEGLAKMIERILKDQGRPTAYISGREASGAFAVGLKYGSGVLHHKVEGDRSVYWTGPSLGFDIGGNASKEFILVYNLYDSQDLYHRFPAAEGTAYFIGGFTASYLRRGDVVLIPIRLGVGWRLGANVGYMKFTPQSKLMPF
ncbi:DUF1134 domain-containing protein [Sphingomonas sp. CGMCC 1.13654]|uniref:DUF1134 domain-containing protein n=1 Tax=Sphingomonas chungangi TaxID=2683589 RepID=A0A838L5Y5_9SPHN|nr:DUF1134 domain-containing protein [Sphingomonas chungangi]MBA2933879.1 DUF1134 domain-containing protein [Sphingomonas chungangi]MVW55208.1 DUF1134 domain-containing protein [Sphingomonas chungangi]